jgi:hypothetical protein
MRPSMAVALVVPSSFLVLGFAACGGKSHTGLATDGDESDASTITITEPDGAVVVVPNPAGHFTSGDGGGGSAGATNCKGGHYSGTFAGSYTSYLTSLFGLGGFPLMVTGNVDMDLQQTAMTSSGEFAGMTTYSIANGTIEGFANNVFPYHCDMVGTLDCDTKQLVGGGLRNCWYCVGLFVSTDGGGCSVYGHFDGPLNASYDGTTFSFVDGTWNGSEAAALDDAGTLPEGGGVNDAGQYVGPGNYGGAGTWNATYSPDN